MDRPTPALLGGTNVTPPEMVNETTPVAVRYTYAHEVDYPPKGARGASSMSVVFCLFGVIGHSGSKAGSRQAYNHASASKAYSVAQNHVANLLAPVLRAGGSVGIFAHAWARPAITSELNATLYAAYRSATEVHVHIEPMRVREHVRSMVLSMSAALLAAREAYASTSHAKAPPTVLLMRHDCVWMRALLLPVGPQLSGSILTGSWCDGHSTSVESLLTLGQRVCVNRTCPSGLCAPLVPYSDADRGIIDYFLIGLAPTLEYFIGSLMHRMQRGEIIHGNNRAHYVLQQHALDLRLPQRGLWSAYAAAVSFVDFELARNHVHLAPIHRTFQAIPSPQEPDTHPCNGHMVCAQWQDCC